MPSAAWSQTRRHSTRSSRPSGARNRRWLEGRALCVDHLQIDGRALSNYTRSVHPSALPSAKFPARKKTAKLSVSATFAGGVEVRVDNLGHADLPLIGAGVPLPASRSAPRLLGGRTSTTGGSGVVTTLVSATVTTITSLYSVTGSGAALVDSARVSGVVALPPRRPQHSPVMTTTPQRRAGCGHDVATCSPNA